MGGNTRSQVGAIGALVALIAVVVSLVAVTVASGDVGGEFSPPDGGLLQLQVGDGDQFVYTPAGGGSVTTQTIDPAQGCSVMLDPSPSTELVSLETTPAAPQGKLGLFANGLGVKVNKEGNGQPCGRVDTTSQELTLSLSGNLAGKQVEVAELDIEGKFNVTVVADLYLGGTGGLLVASPELLTGSNSDSGPDSADGDNFRWVIDEGIFDTIVLRVSPSTPDGAFSLEAGADGTAAGPIGAGLGTLDTVFQLVEVSGLLNCGDSVVEDGGGTGAVPIALLDRGDNELSSCALVPYVLDTFVSGDQFAALDVDLTEQEDATFAITIIWLPEPSPPGSTTIDFGTGPTTPVWCGGSLADPVLPVTGEPWCLVSRSEVLAGDGLVQVTETFFGAGDPIWSR